MNASIQTTSDWLIRTVTEEKSELLQKLSFSSPPQKEEVLLDLQACDRLLARIERITFARSKAKGART